MGVFTVREERLLFSKIGILFIALLHNAQVACSCHILVCGKTCCTIAAYQYTCTYNMLYSLSCVREQCDDGRFVSFS